MSAGRPMIKSNQVNMNELNTGDTLLLGENLLAGVQTANAGMTLTAAAIVSGIITRLGTGGGAGFTDTTDTAQNIINALAGNSPAAELIPGTTFRLRYINTIAQAMTFAAGTGVTLDTTNGSGTLDRAASGWRDYLFTINNSSTTTTQQCVTTNTSKVVTFVLAAGRTARNMGPESTPITPGMLVSGTGITAGTKIDGITLGLGGSIGVHLDTNATATSTALGVTLTFGPSITVSSLGAGTL